MTNLLQDVYIRVMHALDLISQGKTETVACDEARISKDTLEQYTAKDVDLAAMAYNARARGYDTLADILLHIDTDVEYGSSDPKIMKVISDNIKWVLSRRDSKRYGDKVQVEHTLHADKEIVEALSRGKQRALDGVISRVAEDVQAVITGPNDYSHIDVSEFM